MAGVDFLHMAVQLSQIILLADEVFLRFADDQQHEGEAQDGRDNGGGGHDAVGEEHHEKRAQEHGDGSDQVPQGLVHGLPNGVHIVGHPAEHIAEADCVIVAQGDLSLIHISEPTRP